MIVNHDDGEREYEYAVEAVNQLACYQHKKRLGARSWLLKK